MSENDSQKNKIVLPPAEAAGFLRRLADQLEQGSLEIGDVDLETDGEVQIKQSVKTKSDKVSFKLKLKYEKPLNPPVEEEAAAEPGDEAPAEAAPTEEAPVEQAPAEEAPQAEDAAPAEEEEPKKGKKDKDSYKSLKKVMAKQFKAMKKALEAGELPGADMVAQFCQSGRDMTTFDGKKKGAEHYEEWGKLLDGLEMAMETGELEGIKQAVDALDAMKDACHKEFK